MKRARALFWTLTLLLLLSAQALAAEKANPPKTLEEAGLVEVVKLDPSIVLDMRYATPNNFTGKVVYPSGRCFLRKDTAEKLVQVQQDLKAQGMGLKIFDCYRPFSVQKIFFEIVPNPSYVAQPKEKDGKPVEGSKHNRGAAVDLTLVDKSGKEVPMPTEFDDFTEKASPDYKGTEPGARAHMRALQAAMKKRGFQTITSEWWHFDLVGWEKYDLLDVPLPK